MIRFPPTSIGLSESDLEFHLREIQIKEQLYAQGFTRQEVQRYYGERHGNVNGGDIRGDGLPTRTASAATADDGEHPTSSTKPPVVKEGTCTSSDQMSTQRISSSGNGSSVRNPSSTYPGPALSSPMSIPSSPPAMQSSVPYRHATVRQSSLLRIMQNAGSQPSTGSKSSSSDGSPQYESETRPGDYLRYPAARTRSYRPRSKTYTYIESEAEPPTPPSSAKGGSGSSLSFLPCSHEPDDLNLGSAEHSSQSTCPHWNPLSIEFSPKTQNSSPLVLPSPLSVSRRAFSLQVSLPDRTRSSTPSLSQQDPHRPSPPLLLSASPVNLGMADRSIINDLPTTPSTPSASAERAAVSFFQDTSTDTAIARSDTSTHQPSSMCLNPPETPTRPPPQTEPRNPRRPHHGTFGVYNDSLTAEIQPQTPADLQTPRRRPVAERNVAYTAPPGQVRMAGRLVGGDSDGEPGGGVQSPTTRATIMRERRAREFRRWRNARMESVRARSVENESDDEGNAGAEVGDARNMDASMIPELAGGTFYGGGTENDAERRLVGAWGRFSLHRRVREVDWRDEFDEDRVGEENFDATGLLERMEGERGILRGRIMDEGDEQQEVVRFGVLARTPQP